MTKLELIKLALTDLFSEDFSHITPETTLDQCDIEDEADTIELGISVENVLIDSNINQDPPDLSQLFNHNMTIQDCVDKLNEVLE